MADSGDSPRHAALRGLEDSLRWHREAQASRAPAASTPASGNAAEHELDIEDDLFIDETPAPIHYGRRCFVLPRFLGGRVMRRVFVAFAALFVLATMAVGALWYALSNGPISLDLFTDRLVSAIKENLGNGYSVEVGGTFLERDENGRAALRMRDIVVKDAEGAVVASAPRAEGGLAG